MACPSVYPSRAISLYSRQFLKLMYPSVSSIVNHEHQVSLQTLHIFFSESRFSPIALGHSVKTGRDVDKLITRPFPDRRPSY